MLEKIKKIAVIIIIAILFSLFCFSLVDVAMERPDYSTFCGDEGMAIRPLQKELACPGFQEPTAEEKTTCSENKGNIEYSYDGSGCPISYECNTCRGLYEEAGKQYRLTAFVITTILGIIAVIAGIIVTAF